MVDGWPFVKISSTNFSSTGKISIDHLDRETEIRPAFFQPLEEVVRPSIRIRLSRGSRTCEKTPNIGPGGRADSLSDAKLRIDETEDIFDKWGPRSASKQAQSAS